MRTNAMLIGKLYEHISYCYCRTNSLFIELIYIYKTNRLFVELRFIHRTGNLWK